MEIKADVSYGVVPVFKVGNAWQVLVIHQISYRGDDFWIFPKGHVEALESPKETALRELAEETGIKNVSLEPEILFQISYSFKHENIQIDKTVEYYLGYCADTKTIITQPQEIKELRWCDFNTAKDLLTHQNSKYVLTQVEDFLLTS